MDSSAKFPVTYSELTGPCAYAVVAPDLPPSVSALLRTRNCLLWYKSAFCPIEAVDSGICVRACLRVCFLFIKLPLQLPSCRHNFSLNNYDD